MLFPCVLLMLVMLLIMRFLIAKRKYSKCYGCPFAQDCEKKKKNGGFRDLAP